MDAHPGRVRLVRVSGRSFFQVLPRKLRWGGLQGRSVKALRRQGRALAPGACSTSPTPPTRRSSSRWPSRSTSGRPWCSRGQHGRTACGGSPTSWPPGSRPRSLPCWARRRLLGEEEGVPHRPHAADRAGHRAPGHRASRRRRLGNPAATSSPRSASRPAMSSTTRSSPTWRRPATVGRISGWAWAIGYAGGLASLLLCFPLLKRPLLPGGCHRPRRRLRAPRGLPGRGRRSSSSLPFPRSSGCGRARRRARARPAPPVTPPSAFAACARRSRTCASTARWPASSWPRPSSRTGSPRSSPSAPSTPR